MMVKVVGHIENITFEEKIPESSPDETVMYLHASDHGSPLCIEIDDGLAEKLEWAAGRVRDRLDD